MKHVFLLIFFLLFSVSNVFGKIELRSKQMTTTDGLPSNSIRHIYQDSKGFLWLGTLNGLSRYDGNSFLNFYPETINSNQISLVDNHINKLQEDANGFLWIGSITRQVSCYDLQKDRFVDYTGNGEIEQKYTYLEKFSNGEVWLWDPMNGARQIKHQNDRRMTSEVFRTERGNLPDNCVQFIKEDISGRIWLGTKRGLVSVFKGNFKIEDRKQNFIKAATYQQDTYFLTINGDIYYHNETYKKLSLITSLSSVADNATPTDLFILNDQLVIFTNAGVYNFDFKTEKITPNSNLNIKQGKVITDNHKNNWVYNHTGKVCYIKKDGSTKVFQLIPENKMNYIDLERYRIVHDSRGIIWISTYGNGLFAYNVSEDKLEHFTSETKNSPINSDYLLYLAEDKAGGIWVSSEYSGLSRITISNTGINRLFPESPESFDRSNTIRMLTQTEDGEIWIGTRNGKLYNYDMSFNLKDDHQSLRTNVYAIAKDSKGCKWIGTRGGGLKIGDVWYKHSSSDPTTLSNDHIYSIYRDKKNRMWVGTFDGGLNLAEPTMGDKYKFRYFFQEKSGMDRIRTIVGDKNGMIWLGTSNGLYIFHPDSLISNPDNYHCFSHNNRKFCSNEIKCLYLDNEGQMWAGTTGSGLILCKPSADYNTLQYERYGTMEGLVHDVVQSILEDNTNRLWIATEYGITRFNPKNHSFENYFFSSHILGNVYSENCACVDKNEKLLFGTNYGLTIIDPQNVPRNESFFPVVFTNLQINGLQINSGMEESPLKQSLAYSDKITLKYYQNSFTLDFSILNYSDSKRTQYKYWLENYDQEWSAPSQLNFASYKYLNPGTYRLHVKSSNGAGIWNDLETVMEIVITPPFWKTNWAILIYIILLIFVLYSAYRIIYSFNHLRNRINVEKQLTEYKLVFFTNISHEFRTPLTLIQGALEKIQRITNMPKESISPLYTMNKNTQRLLRLINQLLEFRKMQNNKLALSLQETNVVDFLHEIYLNFKDIAEQKKMEFKFQSSVPSFKMFIDKGYLDKVVYNLLSNAFKYTPTNGTILFSIYVDESKKLLHIKVSDTGVGIPKDKQGELFKRFMQSSFASDSIGVGLHLSYELVTVHKGTITYKKNEGGGSIFTVYLPTDKSVYDEKDFLVPDSVLLKDANEYTSYIPQSSQEMSEPEMTTNPLNKRKILIIEDDNDIRTLLKEEIGVYFETEVAEDGLSGIEKARTGDFDLIICDILMPGITGFEVTRKLKYSFETSHIPIILLTALGSQEKQLEGIEAGADAYITKPFSIKYLLARIFKLIEQREKLQEKFSQEPGTIHAAMCSTNRDKEFAERLNIIVEANIARADFTIEEFAQLMKLSRTIFYTKVRGITGYSPVEYLRIIRMKKAAELLLSNNEMTVAEVGYNVGYNDPFYFSKCFKTHFGVSPSVYQKGNK